MFVDPSSANRMPLAEFVSQFEALPSEHIETIMADLLKQQPTLIRRSLD